MENGDENYKGIVFDRNSTPQAYINELRRALGHIEASAAILSLDNLSPETNKRISRKLTMWHSTVQAVLDNFEQCLQNYVEVDDKN